MTTHHVCLFDNTHADDSIRSGKVEAHTNLNIYFTKRVVQKSEDNNKFTQILLRQFCLIKILHEYNFLE